MLQRAVEETKERKRQQREAKQAAEANKYDEGTEGALGGDKLPSKNLKPKRAFLLSFAEPSAGNGEDAETAPEKFIAVDELDTR